MSARVPHIVFASSVPRSPSDALLRAVALTHRHGARLSVLQVVPPGTRPLGMLFPEEALRELQHTETAQRHAERAEAWVRRCAPEAELSFREGAFSAAVLGFVAEDRADLIIAPAGEFDPARDALTLCQESETPLLVARPARSGDAIVAGTDLRDAGLPVVHKAAELAGHLEAPLVVVHNVAPVEIPPVVSTMVPVVTTTDPADFVRRGQVLEACVREVEGSAETVLSCEQDAAQALLAEARARGADIVAVGTHPMGWLERLTYGSVAARVVERARRSVLVLPLNERARGGA